jgi:O-antigen ligase
MEILILIAIPAVLAWILVFVDRQGRTKANLLPTLGLLVLITGCVFGHEFFHRSGGPIPITLDRLFLVGYVGLFGLLWLRGSESLRSFNRADLIIILLMVVVALNTLAHDWRFMGNMPASRLLFLYFVPLSLYLVVRSAKLNAADLKWISILLGGLGVYLAFTAICETCELTSLVFPGYIMTAEQTEFLGRGRGPFLNPVSNGFYMIACLCSIWMWWPSSGLRIRSILLALTAVIVVGIFCTLTRSVWLGFLMSAGVFVWYPASRQLKGLMIILASIAVLISIPFVGEKIFSFKRDKEVSRAEMEQSAQLRPLFAIIAMNMFQDRPLFGCGFGQYAREKYPYLQDPYSGRPLASTKYFMQHNVFLAYLTETGLVGLLVLMAVLMQMTLVSLAVWRNQELDLWARLFGLLMIVVLLNFVISGMFHDVSISPMVNSLLFFTFAIVNNAYSAPDAFKLVRPSSIPAESLPAIIRPRRRARRTDEIALPQPSP